MNIVFLREIKKPIISDNNFCENKTRQGFSHTKKAEAVEVGIKVVGRLLQLVNRFLLQGRSVNSGFTTLSYPYPGTKPHFQVHLDHLYQASNPEHLGLCFVLLRTY